MAITDQPERPPTSREAFEEAIELLRSDRARGFNIDIETDTMVFEDQAAEKQARVEFIGAISSFLKEAVPAAMMFPAMAPVLMEVLMFGVRGFKVGRQLEQVFDDAAEQLSEMKPQEGQGQPGQQQQRTGPDPQVEMAKLKLENQRMMQEMEIEKGKIALALQEFQLERQKVMGELSIKGQKQQADAAAQQAGQAIDAEKVGLERERAETDAMLRQEEIDQRREAAEVQARQRASAPQLRG